MLVQLGSSPRSAEGLDLLLECHARIRRFAGMAARALELPEAASAQAAQDIHRYFTVAYPLHAEDEEQSLLPRLITRGEVALERALRQMRAEHHALELTVGVLLRRCEQARAGEAWAKLAPEIARVGSTLVEGMEAHLRREEETLFPAARRLLGPEEIAEIVSELRARRRPGPRP